MSEKLVCQYICESCEFEFFVDIEQGQPEFCPSCRDCDTLADAAIHLIERFNGTK